MAELVVVLNSTSGKQIVIGDIDSKDDVLFSIPVISDVGQRTPVVPVIVCLNSNSPDIGVVFLASVLSVRRRIFNISVAVVEGYKVFQW